MPKVEQRIATQTVNVSHGEPNSSELTRSEEKSDEELLQQAQREYKAAYDNYVKMLRESGPQTMDTLKALAEYQKKYQIYQILLDAHKSENIKDSTK